MRPNRAGVPPHLKQIRNFISLPLAVALIFPVGNLRAEEPQAAPTALSIVVIEGEGVVNNVAQRSGRDPVVRIEDENRSPVKGAAVVFTLPTDGASGEFANSSKTLTIVTSAEGIAKAQGLKVYRVNGKLPIHVTASYRGLTARTVINQLVEGAPPGAKAPRQGGNGKLIAILAIVGAGAAGGLGAAIASKKSTPAGAATVPSGPSPIGITPGAGTIAPPR
jgi:hypothetical protein